MADCVVINYKEHSMRQISGKNAHSSGRVFRASKDKNQLDIDLANSNGVQHDDNSMATNRHIQISLIDELAEQGFLSYNKAEVSWQKNNLTNEHGPSHGSYVEHPRHESHHSSQANQSFTNTQASETVFKPHFQHLTSTVDRTYRKIVNQNSSSNSSIEPNHSDREQSSSISSQSNHTENIQSDVIVTTQQSSDVKNTARNAQPTKQNSQSVEHESNSAHQIQSSAGNSTITHTTITSHEDIKPPKEQIAAYETILFPPPLPQNQIQMTTPQAILATHPISPPWVDINLSYFNCRIIAKFAHPYYCDKYITCVGGKKAIGTCPLGEAFNSKLSICSTDWSSCNFVQRCSHHNELLADIHYNERFYVCSQKPFTFLKSIYHVHQRACPNGLIFRSDLKSCWLPK